MVCSRALHACPAPPQPHRQAATCTSGWCGQGARWARRRRVGRWWCHCCSPSRSCTPTT
jgi:hypothetical protein